MPKLRHYDNLGTSRFITFGCYHHNQLLNDNNIKRIFVEQLDSIRTKYNIKIYGYVLMPEHVHLVLHPPNDIKLGQIIGYLKGLSAKAALTYYRNNNTKIIDKLQTWQGTKQRTAFWQKRCYDHNCRTSQTTLEKVEYCHKNPVVRGLVKSREEWIWSSYNWYMGAEDVPLVMDEIDL